MKTMRSITSAKNQERNKGLCKKQQTRGGDLIKNREEDEDKALRESGHRTRKSAFGFSALIHFYRLCAPRTNHSG
jgi:hypothetical protein